MINSGTCPRLTTHRTEAVLLRRGTWARVTIDQYRHMAMQPFIGHRRHLRRVLRDAVQVDARDDRAPDGVGAEAEAVGPELDRCADVALEQREVAVCRAARVDLEVVVGMVVEGVGDLAAVCRHPRVVAAADPAPRRLDAVEPRGAVGVGDRVRA